MNATQRAGCRFYAQALLPTNHGQFRVRVYRGENGDEPVALFCEDPAGVDVPVRVHSACFTSESLGSRKCDCGEQLDFSMSYIQRHGGLLIYLQQEGRGIGLGNKIKAYALQEEGHDTISANEALQLPVDGRSYEAVAAILMDLGVASIRLMTNNPAKEEALRRLGIRITGRIPVVIPANAHSLPYLNAKRDRMGHRLGLISVAELDGVEYSAARGLRRKPFVHLNFAGRPRGPLDRNRREQISCSEDWRRVHALREKYDAIAVGARTWMGDKPRLTARKEHLHREPKRQPKRIIFAGKHRVEIDGERPTFIVGSKPPGLEGVVGIEAKDHQLSGPLELLYEQGIGSILVEGGPQLWRSFLGQRLADRITIYILTESIEEALATAYALFPELPGLLHAERFGKGVLIDWTAEGEAVEGRVSREASLV